MTKREALARGATFYFTGKPCLRGHLEPRHINMKCLSCRRERRGSPKGKAQRKAEAQRYSLRKTKRPRPFIHVEAFAGLPRTKAEAVAAGLSFYFTGKPCRKGHLEKRSVKGGCRKCRRVREKARKKRSGPRAKASKQRQKKRRLERIKNDPVLFAAYRCKRREMRRHHQSDPGRRRRQRARKTLREQRIARATPKWADRRALVSFMASKPEGFHLDHILPLRGEFVSGLHVLENLQFIPAGANIAKSNRVDPETLEYAFCRLEAQPRTYLSE